MPLLPSYILRQAWIRIGAYQGQTAAIEASYVLSDPFTNSKNADFTKSAMLDQLVAVEQEMAGAVAGNTKHTWRKVIGDVTVPIASGDEIPAFSVGGTSRKIIGEYGQVRDSASLRPLVNDLSVGEIRAFRDNATVFKSDLFSCAFQKPRLWHTRTNALIDVCFYDFDARKAAIFADNELLFTAAENCYFSGLMSMLKNTDALLVELSKQYEPRYEAWLMAFQAGKESA
jgi:hypothetical protein